MTRRVIFFCMLTMLAIPAHADFMFDDFSDVTRLSLNGSAARSGNVLLLTPAFESERGSAWFDTPQLIRDGFETAFQFQITILEGDTDCEGNIGGDGFAFIIQNSSMADLALGSGSSGIGYAGISNSLVVEFDTECNTNRGDPNGNHLSVHTRGQGENSSDEAFSIGSTMMIPDLSDGSTYTVKIDYMPGSLRVFLDDLTTPILEVSVNLSTILSLDAGFLWAGFTAATGDSMENHAILNWSFTEVVVPIACDADGDGDIDFRDALAVLVFLRTGEPLPGDADCNEDGEVTFQDIFAILRNR